MYATWLLVRHKNFFTLGGDSPINYDNFCVLIMNFTMNNKKGMKFVINFERHVEEIFLCQRHAKIKKNLSDEPSFAFEKKKVNLMQTSELKLFWVCYIVINKML